MRHPGKRGSTLPLSLREIAPIDRDATRRQRTHYNASICAAPLSAKLAMQKKPFATQKDRAIVGLLLTIQRGIAIECM
jgi:hypothetical protein